MHRAHSLQRSLSFALCCISLVIATASVRAADFGPGFKTRSVPVDGATIGVTVGGSGPR
jgi:hypothetical protein